VRKLKNTIISRCGITSDDLRFETSDCSMSVYEGNIKLQFIIDSKGGGKTWVEVKIGKDGIAEILEEIARTIPDLKFPNAT
jgi:hypothetical protein